jgi:uncharacterized protein (TIGR02001 family)
MSKGIAQTQGPQVIPKAFLQLGPIQLGGQWKNVSSPAADGEAAAFVNYAPKLGPYQLTFGAAYKLQTDVKGRPDRDSFEFTSAASRKFGKIGVRIGAIYSPDDLGSTRRSLYLEGGPTFDIDKSTKLSANVGRRDRQGSPDYTAFNAGVSKTLFNKLTLDLRYYDTAQSDLGEAYHGRVVVSARLGL